MSVLDFFLNLLFPFQCAGITLSDIYQCFYLKNAASGRNMSAISFSESLEAVTMEDIDLIFTISTSPFLGLILFCIDRSLSRCQCL